MNREDLIRTGLELIDGYKQVIRHAESIRDWRAVKFYRGLWCVWSKRLTLAGVEHEKPPKIGIWRLLRIGLQCWLRGEDGPYGSGKTA